MAFLEKIKSIYAFNPQSWNLYSYVNGNPVNFYDPMGHDLRGKQGKLGMHQALLGVPNVDISGMLTPVEIYEWFGGNILYGDISTAATYYQNLYFSSHSISGTLNASHNEFTDWVSDLSTKCLNIDAETMYYLKSIYQMSKDYGGELAFYISPTRNNGLGIIVIFGKETEVNPSLSDKERRFFSKTLGFDWQHHFIYGHTHPVEGTKTSSGIIVLGTSKEDIYSYAEMKSCFPWANEIILQEDEQRQFSIQLIDFYSLPNEPFRCFWIAP